MENNFSNELKTLSMRIAEQKETVKTEEATKMFFIVPFFQVLGYNVFNPFEFVPEYTADIQLKNGDKVDYAILLENKPVILIEAKHWEENLDNHIGQLNKYFMSSSAKFGILTNGIEYRFYTDLDELNKMDKIPFLSFKITDLKDNVINELKKFKKDEFSVNKIMNTAEELKNTNSVFDFIAKQFDNPSDEFIKLVLTEIYNGIKTQNVIDKFQPIVKKSFNLFVNSFVNKRIENMLQSESISEKNIITQDDEVIEETTSKIITKEDEIQAFYIIKSILAGFIPLNKITYKDTENYFGILFDNKVTKWICRLKLGDLKKSIIFPEIPDVPPRCYIENLDDIYKYKNEIIKSAERFIDKLHNAI